MYEALLYEPKHAALCFMHALCISCAWDATLMPHAPHATLLPHALMPRLFPRHAPYQACFPCCICFSIMPHACPMQPLCLGVHTSMPHAPHAKFMPHAGRGKVSAGLGGFSCGAAVGPGLRHSCKSQPQESPRGCGKKARHERWSSGCGLHFRALCASDGKFNFI